MLDSTSGKRLCIRINMCMYCMYYRFQYHNSLSIFSRLGSSKSKHLGHKPLSNHLGPNSWDSLKLCPGYNLTMIIPFDISPDMHVWETKDFVDNFVWLAKKYYLKVIYHW